MRLSTLLFVLSFAAACGSDTSVENQNTEAAEVASVPQVPSGNPVVSEPSNPNVAVSNPDLPVFETTAAQLKQNVAATLTAANKSLDAIAKTPADSLTFENLFVAIDDVNHEVWNTYNRIYLIEMTSQIADLRSAAEDADLEIQQWFNGLPYREDLFKATQAFQKRFPNIKLARPDLNVEDLRLIEETQKDFKRAGMALPKDQREAVQALKNKAAELGIEFERNILKVPGEVQFTADELKGVPQIENLKRGDKYIVDVSTASNYQRVAENASLESTRKKIELAVHLRAAKENTPILEQMIQVRDQMAKALGYRSFADYQLEDRMAQNLTNVNKFLLTFRDNLRPKFKAELEEYRKLKIYDLDAADGKIHFWDWRYYQNQYEKEKFSVDKESLRVYFEMNNVQRGVFGVYEEIFQIRITEVEAPYKWVNDLKLFKISDAASKQTIGYLYLDLFPRKNKYNHFAEFGLMNGKKLRNGEYQKPVAALVCNFPKPTEKEPSLLTHDDVSTFFHEFGHALHQILTTARYERFAGTNVPQDFVEAPSQMLEAWAFDVNVLNRFAADYRDPSKKISPEILKKLKEARLATIGTFYSRQLALALADLSFHAPGAKKNSAKIMADTFKKTFLPLPENTNYAASWGHLVGYAASYYGYSWADSVGQDMLTVFQGNLMDPKVGRKLRDEIYAPGWSRPINESVEKFLGRKTSLEAFYKSVGIASH